MTDYAEFIASKFVAAEPAGVENKRESVVALCKRFGEYRLG